MKKLKKELKEILASKKIINKLKRLTSKVKYKAIYKIVNYLYLSCMGIVHLAPYSTTWVIVLYFVSTYGLIINLLISSMRKLKIDKVIKIENYTLIGYLILNCIYHIAISNESYRDYLYGLDSEYWSGVGAFIIVIILLVLQVPNLIKIYREEKNKKIFSANRFVYIIRIYEFFNYCKSYCSKISTKKYGKFWQNFRRNKR